MGRSRATVELIPSARRLIRSLRDVGYDFPHAVADIVDNSIAAGASKVEVDMHFDGKDSWLRIADNGVGMTGTSITEAMRFGTERDYEADELGKFGLGLKTASLSQCSRFTVGSRTSRSAKRIEARQWDLNHIEETNRWEIINVPADERPGPLMEPLQKRTGTVVLWELMDRVMGYKVPWGERAKKGFLKLSGELDQHLGMVFHRFLSGEAHRRKKLRITLNGTEIEPWDPFGRDERATRTPPPKQMEIQGDEGAGLVEYTPYILPARDQFSSLNAFHRLAGPRKWNYQQGFYIYRADRMIQSGGWCRMRTSDEHTKLARVALDFWPDLDSAFDLNVAKARVNLPADLKTQLKPLIEQHTKEARKNYSSLSKRPPAPPSNPHNPQPGTETSGATQEGPTVKGHKRSPQPPNSTRTPPEPRNKHIGRALDQAASAAGEKPSLNRIKKTLKTRNPAVSTDLGW